MVQHEPHFILEVFDNGFGSLAMRACSNGIEWWWHLYDGDGGRRNKAFLHMMCILDRFLDVLLGLSTQPTPREVDRKIGRDSNGEFGGVGKVKALGANGDMSGSRVGVVWMEVGSGIMRARVVSRVVLGLVVIGLSCLRDHYPPLGEELEKVNQMAQSWKELELGDEAFFPHA
ncbi:hypothetical protein Tco_0295460 [Tanacetum coccineum]